MLEFLFLLDSVLLENPCVKPQMAALMEHYPPLPPRIDHSAMAFASLACVSEVLLEAN